MGAVSYPISVYATLTKIAQSVRYYCHRRYHVLMKLQNIGYDLGEMNVFKTSKVLLQCLFLRVLNVVSYM